MCFLRSCLKQVLSCCWREGGVWDQGSVRTNTVCFTVVGLYRNDCFQTAPTPSEVDVDTQLLKAIYRRNMSSPHRFPGTCTKACVRASCSYSYPFLCLEPKLLYLSILYEAKRAIFLFCFLQSLHLSF